MSTFVLIRRICTFSAGPQDLPYSPVLTRNLVLGAAAVSLGFAWLMDVQNPVIRVGLSLLLMLAVPQLLLGLRQRSERYPQTLAALAGTDMLFTLGFIPIAWMAKSNLPAEAGATLDPGQVALGWAMLAVFGWKLVVTGHILRHALDLPSAIGVLLSLAWFGVELALDQALLGSPA